MSDFFLHSTRLSWTDLKAFASSKGLGYQYQENAEQYWIYLVEASQLVYWTEIWKSGAALPSGVDGPTNTANRADWEANYQPTANMAVRSKSSLVSLAGVELGVTDGLALPANQQGFISVGYDGTNLRFLRTDSSGRQVLVGAGTAGTPAGGVLSVQGVSGGQALPISATQLPTALVGGRLDTNIGGWMGSTAPTVGQKAMASSLPVVIASNQSAIPVSQNGTWTVQQGTPPWSVVGPGASGAALSGDPVRVAGSDGTNTRNILTDTSGRQVAVGAAASGAVAVGNPVLVAGSDDSSNARTIKTETDGVLRVKRVRSSTGTTSNVSASTTSVTVLVANANRLGATVFNDSPHPMYLKAGVTASTTSFTVIVPRKGYYEMPFNYTGILTAVWGAATGSARVTEFT